MTTKSNHEIFHPEKGWFREQLHVFVCRNQQIETSPHEHVFHEIAFIEAGTADHITVEGSQKLHPGDVIILKPRTWHQYLNPKNLQLINCVFDNRLLRDYRAFFELSPIGFDLFRRPASKSRNTPPTMLHASPTQQKQLLSYLDAMLSEQSERSKDWEAAVIAQLLGFLIAIGRIEDRDMPQSGSALGNYAEKAVIETVHYLEKNFRETITLGDLSKRFHFSEAYLSRIFSKHMGMGVIQFLHHLRIEEACRLLRFTMEPVTQIADMVGYDELPYFSRRFRQEIGSSPREYRTMYNGHFKLFESNGVRVPDPLNIKAN